MNILCALYVHIIMLSTNIIFIKIMISFALKYEILTHYVHNMFIFPSNENI